MEPFIYIFLLVTVFFILLKYYNFKESNYYEATGNTFIKTMTNKAKYDEYCTFSQLEKSPCHSRLLTNLMLPRKDGSIIKIHLLMISEAGLYVMEAKKASGWIYGDEKHKNWLQIRPKKDKKPFPNPIWQNKAKISTLKSVLRIADDKPFKSYIIFSGCCRLNKIKVASPNVNVIKRKALRSTIYLDSSNPIFTKEEIEHLFIFLKRYLQKDQFEKVTYINQARIKEKIKI